MTVLHTEATIANAGTTSGIIDLADRVLVAIHMPSDWDTATLTIHASPTETGTYSPIASDDFTEAMTAAASTVIIVNPNMTRGLRFIKLVASGAQTPARTFYLATVEDDRA